MIVQYTLIIGFVHWAMTFCSFKTGASGAVGWRRKERDLHTENTELKMRPSAFIEGNYIVQKSKFTTSEAMKYRDVMLRSKSLPAAMTFPG